MRRRDFITLIGAAAAAWPLAARVQQPPMPVVGFLRSTAAAGSEPLVRAFRQGLNQAVSLRARTWLSSIAGPMIRMTACQSSRRSSSGDSLW